MASLAKRIATREEELFGWLVDRSTEKTPNWHEDGVKWKGWEGWILDHWPHKLTFGYWYYIFHDLEGKGDDRYWSTSDEFPNWINFPEWGEWRYLFRRWDGKQAKYIWDFNLKWVWIQLTDETKGIRLICRLRGHPRGEVYYNPGGFEPDHRCKDCGEEIG